MILGQNPPEIAYWERGEWWLAGEAKPRHPEAGIERGKARRVASVTFDAIHDNVARKVDVLASVTSLRADIGCCAMTCNPATRGLTRRSPTCAPISPWSSIGC